jgi:predicted permease
MLTDLLHRLRALLRRRVVEREVDEELRFHLGRQVEKLVQAGHSRAEAERRARIDLGGLDQVREEYRDALGVRLVDELRRDVVLAWRRMRRQPGSTTAAVLTLALSIGGTAATYGVARKILFDPLPYDHQADVGVFWKKTDWTEEEFLFIRGRTPGFEQVALYRQRDVIMRTGSEPARLLASVNASAELFEVLGAQPLLGRTFRVGDDVPGAEPVAVLSFGLWQELGGDPSVLGSRVTIDGTPRTVVGVMPSGFWFPDTSVDVLTPVPLSPQSRSWNSTLVGRVAPGYDVRAMGAPVRQLVGILDERFDYPAQWDKTRDAAITPLREDLSGSLRPALFATLGGMALIFLMACANAGALMLGKVESRSVELAVCSALGASRRRLMQSLLAEAACTALIATGLGAAFAWAGFSLLANALPLGAWTDATAPDSRIVISAVPIAVLAAMLVAGVPALSLGRGDLRGVMVRARTGGIEGRGGRLENILVVAEVTLAVIIAAGAAVLVRSVSNLYDIDPGVRIDDVAVVDVIISGQVQRERAERTIEDLTTALEELPGVERAAATQVLPLTGGGYNLPLRVIGRPDIQGMTTEYRVVTPGYLESIGLALRQGRTIAETDRRGTERVVVINEALAERYLAPLDPIGRVIGGDTDLPARVVGIVANAAERGLTDSPQPVRYVALAQMEWVDETQSLVVRVVPGVDEASLLDAARRTIERVAPGAAVQQTTTMARVLDGAVGPARQVMQLLTVLAMVGLTLAAVGVYGVMAHFATRRRRDWAIRVALGLTGSRVMALVAGHGAWLILAGIGLGFCGAAVLTRLLSSLVYGVAVVDPAAFAAAGAALLAIGMIAVLVPAWRAGRVDPATILREP